MSTGRSDEEEKELTEMEEDDINQFVIRMSKNEGKYKAQAELLYKAGVTARWTRTNRESTHGSKCQQEWSQKDLVFPSIFQSSDGA